MLEYQFRPIELWPGEKTKDRRRSQFSAGWVKTLDLLERELGYLKARNIVLQAAVGVVDIRNDGMLRANAKPTWPGVILSFDSKNGALSYPCDTYWDWQSNVRAIALALEALRSVDRYGVSAKGQQYRGWERLAGPTVPTEFRSPQEAAEWLVKMAAGEGNSRFVVESPSEMEECYRRACLRTHPDHHPDRTDDFKRVQAAKVYLEKHFGSAA